MEHQKLEKFPWGYNSDVIEIINVYIQKFVKDKFENDTCKPEYIVSLYNGDMNNQHILVTIKHLGQCFTENVFPRRDAEYGYDCLDNLLIDI